MNFLTVQDIVTKIPLGSKMYRHTQGSYFGREYTLEKVIGTISRPRIQVSYVRPDGHLQRVDWYASNVERKHLLTHFDPYLVVATSSQPQVQNLPRSGNPNSLGAPYGQHNKLAFKDLVLGMIIKSDMNPHEEFEVMRFDKSSRVGWLVRIESKGVSNKSPGLVYVLTEADYNQYDWSLVKPSRNFNQAAGRIVRNTSQQIMNNPCAEIALDPDLKIDHITMNIKVDDLKPSHNCMANMRKENFGFFANTWHEYCTVCGKKKEEVSK